MKRLLLFLAGMMPGVCAFAQTGIYSPLMHKSDSLINKFMQTWSIDGGTVAITKNGKLIYSRGFGYADQAHTETMKPYHLLRIASNSKAITGIAILRLIQDAQLNINDTVFGAGRILDQSYYLSAITDNRIKNITVKQLLEHTAGWDRDIPCAPQSHCDPIGFPLYVTTAMGEGNPVGDSTLIKFLITKGLNYTPGATYAYSNIGYLVLAKVIERKTGMRYDEYVNSVIMQPLGLCDMHLGKNLLADKQEREGEYNNTFTTLSAYGTNQTVPWQYGGWNLEAMHAHGGWISTSEDYVRMILAVDGFAGVPDILSPASITLMTTGSAANTGYAKGWSVNAAGNWWHTGSLDGASSFMARTANGYTWAFHFNERNNAPAFYSALDALPWNCIGSTPTYPAYDLFAPQQQAANLVALKTGATTAQISWTAGGGTKRLVLAKESAAPNAFPVAGSAYTADAAFGAGNDLGGGTFAVYSGTGTSSTITGLNPAKTYYFTVMEMKDDASTGNNAVYKYGCRSAASVNMVATGIAGGVLSGFAVYPNPAHNTLVLANNEHALAGSTAVLTDASGRRVGNMVLRYGRQTFDISGCSPGVYLLRLANGECLKVVKQ